jgi:uncharacterized membrane protein
MLAPGFLWMKGAVSLDALYMIVLILATQRRKNESVARQEHFTLELALLGEQKTAKIISLLEEPTCGAERIKKHTAG